MPADGCHRLSRAVQRLYLCPASHARLYLHPSPAILYGMAGDLHRRRLKHHDIPGHAHYITCSCWGKKPLLSRDRTRQWFVEAIDRARRQYGFSLWAYVVMPEHAHILILPQDESRVGSILQSIKLSTSRRAMAWLRAYQAESLATVRDVQPSGRVEYRFWLPGGGYDRNIWSAQELWEKVQYIHRNPVRRGLAQSPEEWRWSSWNAWQGDADVPLAVDRDTFPSIQRA